MLCYLIDDDVDDQEFFSLALQEVNPSFQLMTSDSGVDALDQLRSKKVSPDIIFLDINMPRVDGWECLKRLQTMDHLMGTPVVIYSTSEPSYKSENSKGFSSFLTKQSKISELVEKLKELFLKIDAGKLC